jgi:hypothetical protein
MTAPPLLTILLLAAGAHAFTLTLHEGDSTRTRNASVTPLPFVFHSQFFQWTAGVYLRSQDLVQDGAQFDVVLFGSSNGTCYLYHQMRDFRLPGLDRLVFEPTVFAGRFGEIRAYTDMPDQRLFTGDGERYPGRQHSDPDHFLPMEGEDLWLRGKLRWLLPLGHGNVAPPPRPVLRDGFLVDGARGGLTGGPASSGLSWAEVEPFYREQLGTVMGGATLSLTRENWDHEDDPFRGSFQQVSWQRDPGGGPDRPPWSLLQLDLRHAFPLVEGGTRGAGRIVLMWNSWAGLSPTWNDSHVEDKGTVEERRVLHRPPVFAAPALGGDTRLRAYYQNRFNDKAFLYHGAELRRTLGWRPPPVLPIHWVQTALFAEAGRVAGVWDLRRLHRGMAWSAGAGVRLLFTDLVLRLDVAAGREGTRVQMFMGQAF